MPQTKTILDYGCGLGGHYSFLHKRGRYTGVDILEENITYAQKRYGAEYFQRVDGMVLSFPDGYFDEVHSYEVLEHVSDLTAVLGELARVLKPGGQMFFTFPVGVSEQALLRAKPDYFEEVGHVRVVDTHYVKTFLAERGVALTSFSKIRGMEALVYWVLFNLKKGKQVAYQTGSPQFSKWLVAFIWLFDRRLFHTVLKYFFFIYIFTLPIGWLISQVFPKSYAMEFVKKSV